MKTYKLTPLEELRLEKKRLREERTIAGQRLSYQLQYFNDNWGSMITKGITSSIKSKFADTVDNFSSGTSSSVTPFVTKRSNPWLGIITSNLPQIGGIAWRLAKPAVFAFGARRLSSMFFGKKSKRKRR